MMPWEHLLLPLERMSRCETAWAHNASPGEVTEDNMIDANAEVSGDERDE